MNDIGNDAPLQAHAEHDDRVEQFTLLNRMTQRLETTSDCGGMLEIAAETMCCVVPDAAVHIGLLNEECTEFVVSMTAPESQIGTPLPWAAVSPFAEHLFQQHQPVRIVDVNAAPLLQAHRPFWERIHANSLLILPLATHNARLGIAAISTPHCRHFSANEIALAETIAGIAAAAMANHRLLDKERRQRQLFETLMRTSPVATVLTDLKLRIMSWNLAAEQLFGYSAEETVGQLLPDLVARASRYEEALAFMEQIQRGQSIRVMTQRNRKDGQLVDVELYAAPVVINDRVTAYIALYHDITELEHARQRAEAANRAKMIFLANMSHELRTPLTAILGFSDLLLHHSALAEDEQMSLQAIHHNGEHLLLLLNNLLDLARLENGEAVLEEQDLDLYRLCNELAHMLAMRFTYTPIAFHYAPDLPQIIRADSVKMHQILLHLLTDLVKFNSPERVDILVSMTETLRLHVDITMQANAAAFEKEEMMLTLNRQMLTLIGAELHVRPLAPVAATPTDAPNHQFIVGVVIPVSRAQATELSSALHPSEYYAAETVDYMPLTAMPRPFLERLEYAALTANVMLVATCLQEMQTYHAEYADLFLQLSENFEYAKMLALIEQAKAADGGETI